MKQLKRVWKALVEAFDALAQRLPTPPWQRSSVPVMAQLQPLRGEPNLTARSLGPANLHEGEPLVDRISGGQVTYVGPYGPGGVHIEVRDGNGMLRHILRAGVKRPPRVA